MGEIIRAVATSARVTLGAENVTVLELLPDRDALVARVPAADGSLGAPVVEAGDTDVAAALEAGAPIVVEDFDLEAARRPLGINGQQRPRSGVAVPIPASAERPFGVLAAYWMSPRLHDPRDVSLVESLAFVLGAALQRDSMEQELERRDLHDALTELPNRTLLRQSLAQALSRCAGGSSTTAVLVVGIDRFKAVNELLGHCAGDDLLRTVSVRLRAALRPDDTLGRLGGDHFAAVCQDVRGERHALELAARVLDAVRDPAALGDERELFVTASVGIATASRAGESPDALLRDAESAMYRAKANGGARCELFDRDVRRRLLDRLRVEADLRRAISEGELAVVYQPLVSLEHGETVGLEALVRWEHPERGLVPPAAFIPIAEENGLIVPIGAWVLEQACRQLARWSTGTAGAGLPYVSVNISGRQLADAGFASFVTDVLDRTGIERDRLVLEITETVLMERADSPTAALQELKAAGVRLVLDDFGTGYSSLSYLKRFPLDALKIDRSFVAGIADDEHDRRIVEAVIGMATALGIEVVAEGIETEQQAERLLDLGCRLGQGYHFAPPMPAAALEGLLTAGLGGPARRSGAPPRRSVPGREEADRGEADADGEATITLGEAAQALGVSASTLRRWEEQGRISALRTRGGHRRFRVSEVRRLNARRAPGSQARVRPLEPPARPAASVADLLDGRWEELSAAACKALYRGSGRGWFGSNAAREHIERWVRAVASACRSGGYAPAVEASIVLARQAMLAGTTTLERDAFIEWFGHATLRLLAGPAQPSEVPAARRLFVALRHAVLEAGPS